MMENYSAWKVDKDQFPTQGKIKEKLCFLLRYAVLAPSSHNSQPWSFGLTDETISVFLNSTRLLPFGDPDSHLSMMSIGAAIENIQRAGNALGQNVAVRVQDPDQEGKIAEIMLLGERQSSDEWILNAILERSSNRNPYVMKPYPAEFLAEIDRYAKEHDVHIVRRSEQETKKLLADIITSSSATLMGSKTFRNELSQHVHPNTTHEKTGMPAFGMGIPTPVSFFVPFLLKNLNMQKLSQKADTAILVDHTPALFFLFGKGDSTKDRIAVGRVYQYAGLLAVRYGMQASAWGAVTIDKKANIQVCEILKETGVLHFVFRIGIPTRVTPHSPRLTVEDTLREV